MVDIGSRYLPSDILAAFLFAQLERKEKSQTHRRQVWETYQSGLNKWANKHDMQLPQVPENCQQAYRMFYVLMPE